MAWETRIYLVQGLFADPTSHTIVDDYPIEILTVQLDSSLEDVANVPQGDGCFTFQMQTVEQKNALLAHLPVTGDYCFIITDETWNPASERPPADAYLIADFDFESLTIGTGDC